MQLYRRPYLVIQLDFFTRLTWFTKIFFTLWGGLVLTDYILLFPRQTSAVLTLFDNFAFSPKAPITLFSKSSFAR